MLLAWCRLAQWYYESTTIDHVLDKRDFPFGEKSLDIWYNVRVLSHHVPTRAHSPKCHQHVSFMLYNIAFDNRSERGRDFSPLADFLWIMAETWDLTNHWVFSFLQWFFTTNHQPSLMVWVVESSVKALESKVDAAAIYLGTQTACFQAWVLQEVVVKF